ncbi:MAG: lysylphosphatidylglycerol synthase domain-containing protein [Gaiellaceae bacterium]
MKTPASIHAQLKHVSRRTAAASAAAVLLLAAAAASPPLLGSRVSAALDALGGADQRWLAVGACGFVLSFVCTVASWRAALAAAGGRICPRQAAARLGIGSMVNSFAPAKLGDAVKIALCAKAIEGPGRIWTTGGAYAGLAAARSLSLAGLLVVASATGAMPLWPVFALCGGVGVLVVAARFSGRLRRHSRVAQLLGALAALERSPSSMVIVLAWTVAMVLARVGATAAVAVAFGLPHPLLAALLVMAALDVAAVFPLTPGNIGIGSGAVAVALASRGIGVSQALGVGFAIQALETLVSISAGTAGALYLTRPNAAVRRWTLRLASVAATAGLAAVLGLVVVSLV